MPNLNPNDYGKFIHDVVTSGGDVSDVVSIVGEVMRRVHGARNKSIEVNFYTHEEDDLLTQIA